MVANEQEIDYLRIAVQFAVLKVKFSERNQRTQMSTVLRLSVSSVMSKKHIGSEQLSHTHWK
jgi:hypothetical protein